MDQALCRVLSAPVAAVCGALGLSPAQQSATLQRMWGILKSQSMCYNHLDVVTSSDLLLPSVRCRFVNKDIAAVGPDLSSEKTCLISWLMPAPVMGSMKIALGSALCIFDGIRPLHVVHALTHPHCIDALIACTEFSLQHSTVHVVELESPQVLVDFWQIMAVAAEHISPSLRELRPAANIAHVTGVVCAVTSYKMAQYRASGLFLEQPPELAACFESAKLSGREVLLVEITRDGSDNGFSCQNVFIVIHDPVLVSIWRWCIFPGLAITFHAVIAATEAISAFACLLLDVPSACVFEAQASAISKTGFTDAFTSWHSYLVERMKAKDRPKMLACALDAVTAMQAPSTAWIRSICPSSCTVPHEKPRFRLSSLSRGALLMCPIDYEGQITSLTSTGIQLDRLSNATVLAPVVQDAFITPGCRHGCEVITHGILPVLTDGNVSHFVASACSQLEIRRFPRKHGHCTAAESVSPSQLVIYQPSLRLLCSTSKAFVTYENVARCLQRACILLASFARSKDIYECVGSTLYQGSLPASMAAATPACPSEHARWVRALLLRPSYSKMPSVITPSLVLDVGSTVAVLILRIGRLMEAEGTAPWLAHFQQDVTARQNQVNKFTVCVQSAVLCEWGLSCEVRYGGSWTRVSFQPDGECTGRLGTQERMWTDDVSRVPLLEHVDPPSACEVHVGKNWTFHVDVVMSDNENAFCSVPSKNFPQAWTSCSGALISADSRFTTSSDGKPDATEALWTQFVRPSATDRVAFRVLAQPEAALPPCLPKDPVLVGDNLVACGVRFICSAAGSLISTVPTRAQPTRVPELCLAGMLVAATLIAPQGTTSASTGYNPKWQWKLSLSEMSATSAAAYDVIDVFMNAAANFLSELPVDVAVGVPVLVHSCRRHETKSGKVFVKSFSHRITAITREQLHMDHRITWLDAHVPLAHHAQRRKLSDLLHDNTNDTRVVACRGRASAVLWYRMAWTLPDGKALVSAANLHGTIPDSIACYSTPLGTMLLQENAVTIPVLYPIVQGALYHRLGFQSTAGISSSAGTFQTRPVSMILRLEAKVLFDDGTSEAHLHISDVFPQEEVLSLLHRFRAVLERERQPSTCPAWPESVSLSLNVLGLSPYQLAFWSIQAAVHGPLEGSNTFGPSDWAFHAATAGDSSADVKMRRLLSLPVSHSAPALAMDAPSRPDVVNLKDDTWRPIATQYNEQIIATRSLFRCLSRTCLEASACQMDLIAQRFHMHGGAGSAEHNWRKKCSETAHFAFLAEHIPEWRTLQSPDVRVAPGPIPLRGVRLQADGVMDALESLALPHVHLRGITASKCQCDSVSVLLDKLKCCE